MGTLRSSFSEQLRIKDASGLQTSLNDLTTLSDKTVKAVSQLGDNLASLTQLVDSNLTNTQKGFALLRTAMEKLTEETSKRLKEIHDYEDKVDGDISDLRGNVAIVWQILSNIVPNFSDLIKIMLADAQISEAIQAVLQGFLPISMVTPHELQDGLNIALEGIEKEFPTAQLSHGPRELGFYYTHKVVTPIIQPNQLILMVDIPVDLQQEILYVYSVRTFPVPLLLYNPYTHSVDPMSKSSVAQSLLQLPFEHFLITPNGDYWSSASSSDINACSGESMRYCKKQFPLYKLGDLQCIELLWKNVEFEKILSACNYVITHVRHASTQVPYINIVPLANGKWYISSSTWSQWTVECPNRPPEVRSPCSSCVISLDCGCGLNNEWFRIPTRVSGCTSVFSSLSHNYSLNPFSYLPESHPWVINLTGDKWGLG